MKRFWSLVREAAAAWVEHDAASKGAALAYYSVLSIAPLAIITIAIAGFVFGDQAAQGQIVYEIQGTIGKAGAEVVQSVLQNAHRPASGIAASVLGLLMLLVGASGVFTELRSSLNRVWEVPRDAEPAGISGAVRIYFFSFALVVSIGFLLLVSLILSTALSLFERWLASRVPSPPVAAIAFNIILTFVVIVLLFALIYKVVPDARILWREVWFGAVCTAFLFTVGKLCLALYIGILGVGSAYGAAGSLIVMLVWIYYSAQIFFFGAEITRIHAKRLRERRRAMA